MVRRAEVYAEGQQFLVGFRAWLRAEGFAASTVGSFVGTAGHVIRWARREGIVLDVLDDAAIERFRLHLRECRCPGPRPPRLRDRTLARRATRFLEYLRVQGVVEESRVVDDGHGLHPLITQFGTWMREHRGVTATTLQIYGRVVSQALEELGDDPSAYHPRGLRDFVLTRATKYGRSKAKLIVTAMRAFLRFLAASGACLPGLEGALPTIARWRLATLPRYLSCAEVDRVLATCDPLTTVGVRNRAILLLLARLGLRASDVALLDLAEIDWRGATFTVAGKSRRAACLPLPQEVGDAILGYLARRPQGATTGRVFLRVTPPWRPLAPGTVSSVAARAIRFSEIVADVRGAHVLRHSAASELLRRGASLDQVRLVLRHRDPETTRLYAKVDVGLLREVAQPWPEVMPC